MRPSITILALLIIRAIIHSVGLGILPRRYHQWIDQLFVRHPEELYQQLYQRIVSSLSPPQKTNPPISTTYQHDHSLRKSSLLREYIIILTIMIALCITGIVQQRNIMYLLATILVIAKYSYHLWHDQGPPIPIIHEIRQAVTGRVL